MKRLILIAICSLGVLVSCKKEESDSDAATAIGEAAAKKMANSINVARFNEIPKRIHMLMDQCVVYEATNGEWPTDIAVLEVNVESKFFDYELVSRANEYEIEIKARIKEGKKIGTVPSGAYVAVASDGDKSYSHLVLAEEYLKAYLRGAKYVGNETKRQ